MYRPSLKLSMEIVNLAIEISVLATRCEAWLEGRQGHRGFDCGVGRDLCDEPFQGDYDVFSLSDFLRAHADLAGANQPDGGSFRTGNGCVFNGKMCIHLAPPASEVPYMMQELFQWLQKSEDHLLIRACIFHYALDYIRPFKDGNGRMGLLWQSLLQKKLSPVLSNLSREHWDEDQQRRYYFAFVKAIKAGEAGPFVEFLLQGILDLLKNIAESLKEKGDDAASVELSIRQNKILDYLREKTLTVEQIAKKLKVSSRTVEREMSKLQQMGAVYREGSDKTGSWRVR